MLEIEYKTAISHEEYTAIKNNSMSRALQEAPHALYYFDTEDFALHRNNTCVRLYIVPERDLYILDKKTYIADDTSMETPYAFKTKEEAKEFLANPDEEILRKIGVKVKVKPFVESIKSRLYLKSTNPNIIEVCADEVMFIPLHGPNMHRAFIDYDLEMEVKEEDYITFLYYLAELLIVPKFAKRKQMRAYDYYHMK